MPSVKTALILGLLSAVSPFAIDMYLPAMPAIEGDLGTSVSGTQMSVTAYFLSFGLAQLFYGPVADRFGRKPPIYIGLVIFLIGTIACALAPDIRWLVGARFVQGLGGAALMVVPRAIIRDMHSGPEATKMMAMIMLVISVSPMLAPLVGSGVIAIGGWRAVFWVIGAAGLASLVLLRLAQPETLRPENRAPIEPRALMRNAGTLVRDPVFLGLTFVGGLGISSFFVFLTSAPFVYTGQFGLSPTQFSLAFAANAIGFFSASQMAGPLGARLGMNRLVFRGTAGFATMSCLLALAVAAGGASLFVVVGMLFLANACLGLVIPSVMVMALDPHPEIAGLASSMGGTLQMLAGAGAVMLASPFFDGTALPMVVAIAICALAAFGIAAMLVKPWRRGTAAV